MAKQVDPHRYLILLHLFPIIVLITRNFITKVNILVFHCLTKSQAWVWRCPEWGHTVWHHAKAFTLSLYCVNETILYAFNKLRFMVLEIQHVLDKYQLFLSDPRNSSGGRQIALLFWWPPNNSSLLATQITLLFWRPQDKLFFNRVTYGLSYLRNSEQASFWSLDVDRRCAKFEFQSHENHDKFGNIIGLDKWNNCTPKMARVQVPRGVTVNY